MIYVEYFFSGIIVIACITIFLKLVYVGTAISMFDEGHSGFEREDFVIRPRWPFAILVSSIMIYLDPTCRHEFYLNVLLCLLVIVWFYLWVYALIRYKPLLSE